MTGDSLISIPTLHGVRTALMSQIHGYKIKNDETLFCAQTVHFVVRFAFCLAIIDTLYIYISGYSC